MQDIYQRIAVRQYWIPLVTSHARRRRCWDHLIIYTSWVPRKARCWAQYFFFCISMVCVDPQIRCSDINNVHASVNRELVEVDNWLKTKRLSLNVSKTSCMIISNQKNAIDIKIRDSIRTNVSTVKFRGVTFDGNLTFNDHVKSVTSIISKSVGVIIE